MQQTSAYPATVDAKHSRNRLVQRRIWLSVALMLFYAGLARALQWYVGAFQADFARYPDEPAHYVTTLMLDCFLRSGQYLRPMQFAEQYYLHYPKVGIGHWPPLLYIVQLFWMLAFGPGKQAILTLHALIAGAAAFTLYREGREFLGYWAIAIGAAFLTIPAVVDMYAMVMADMLLLLFLVLATVSLGRYALSGSGRSLSAWALYSVLAILTKGTGWLLLPLPIAVALLAANSSMIRSRRFFIAAAAVIGVCLPWQILTMHMVLPGWEADKPTPTLAVVAVGEIVKLMLATCGIPISVLGFVGIAHVIWNRIKGTVVDPFQATIAASIIAQIAFHALVPTGVEFRKVSALVPMLILLAIMTVLTITRHFRTERRPWIPGAAAGLILVSLVPLRPYTRWPPTSFAAVAVDLLRSTPPESAVLISSELDGEGALISEVALRAPNPSFYAVRGTKLLADISWDGTQVLRPSFSQPTELDLILDSVPVDYVVLDLRPSVRVWQHHQQLAAYLKTHSSKWGLAGRYGGRSGSGCIALYRRLTPTLGPAHVRVSLARTLGRTLTSSPPYTP
ncbi:MAG TPA: glycosyltransferase family 39 protein [Bryobacteraceae bacterium]|jgi:4-amino-4-deoxy-L-arabinose transferase-like glycosyltransferase|nr:glycosyltransferase family 39 protein [Bryobacteraceae bacterium]